MEEEEAADAEPEMALWPEVGASMIKTPPNRPGITFEVGARLEAQDYLLKWYPSKIEKIDYEQEKMLIHFERWSSRYDEWIHWDSTRLRPLERPSLRKEGLKEEEENYDFKEGDEVLARWTDCRYYPAKIETINKEGTYTVQFYDGVIRCLKKMHIKYMPEDAKGQDWIALVKVAAAAAAKTKPAGKPRTSANSNKDKEEKRHSKGPVKKEEPVFSNPTDVIQKEEEKPTSSRTLDIAVDDVPKTPVQQPDDELLLKRKISEATSFQAKRARLNKITGVCVEDLCYNRNSYMRTDCSHQKNERHRKYRVERMKRTHYHSACARWRPASGFCRQIRGTHADGLHLIPNTWDLLP
uniref:PHD finger protein 20 like 1 n=1 Tax=Leptobrachium leishanense TaxID=445787 RepID=A0A8C5MZ84_9ANUR